MFLFVATILFGGFLLALKNLLFGSWRHKYKGLTINSGKEVKELRRFTVKTLAQLGLGKNQLMPQIINEQLSELSELLEDLDILIESTGNKVPVVQTFVRASINIVSGCVSGQKFPRDGKTLPELIFIYSEVAQLDLIQFIMVEYFPMWFLLSLDRFGTGYNRFLTNLKAGNRYFTNVIEERLKLVRNGNPENFIDAFLLEVEKHKDNPDLKEVYNTEQLACVLFDIFLGGIDTTSKFIEIACILMALNPNIQVKVQEEIDSIIGDKVPSYLDHRAQMPFTQATIWEVHRIANIITQTSRLATKDFTLDGHNFKKGTVILHAFFYYRMDECFWGDPKVFRPQRYLDSENNFIMEKVHHVLPYGLGFRVCLGEHVASVSTFSFLNGILQKYNIGRSDPTKELIFDMRFNFVNRPEPFHVTLSPRC